METPSKFSLPKEPYLTTGAIIGIIALMYAPLIIYWYDGWINKSIGIEHEYFSHGVIGLPFAAYLVWQKREQLLNLAEKFQPMGAVLLGLAGAFYLSGIPDLINLSFPITLAGLCLWFKGVAGLKLMRMPLIFVLLATPNHIPYLIQPLALPIQRFIAGSAAFILMQLGVNLQLEEIYLYIGDRIVEVAPHCAGLKMLFTSIYVGLMLLQWTGAIQSRTKTVFFLLTAAFISATGNIIRNTLLTVFHGTEREAAFHWLHEGWGGDMYSAAMLGLLVLLIWWIEHYFGNNYEEEEYMVNG
jgi:cyanoexosortase B